MTIPNFRNSGISVAATKILRELATQFSAVGVEDPRSLWDTKLARRYFTMNHALLLARKPDPLHTGILPGS